MSTIIHMNTEEVTRIITRIRQIEQTISERVNNAAVQASNMDWTGSDRDYFIDIFQNWKQPTLSRLSELQNMADRLSAEQNQWIQADSDGGNRLKSAIGDVSLGSAWVGFTTWLSNLFKQKEQQYSIDDAWQQMIDTKSGNKLIALAKELGIKFVLPSGKTIGDGDHVVNITIEDLEPGTAGSASPGSIKFDQEVMDRAYKSPDYLAQVLAHEIQHQVDREKGLLPAENISSTILQNLRNGDRDSAEKLLKEAIQKRAESEIRAHNIGYEVDSGDQKFENVLNDDGTASKEEINFVIKTRDYESNYEDDYNSEFPGYRVDVFLDDAGQIQCNIVSLNEA